MGMYWESKEIPPGILKRILERPWDADYVDGILFRAADGSYDWSPAMRRTELSDQALMERFSFPHLTLSLEQMRTLGTLDGGKYMGESEMGEVPFLSCLLSLNEPGRSADLDFLLNTAQGSGRSHLAVREDMNKRFSFATPQQVRISPHYTWSNQKGEKYYGFTTDVPCYGIPSYTPAADLASTWNEFLRVFELYPEHLQRVLAVFGDEVTYYYGCAMRESAELSVMW